MLAPRPALAGPNGGSVVAGSAGIQQSGNTTNINQSSNSAVINWQGFSIGKQETVNFNQPSAASTTLNRVIGNETSVINGALNANGQVFIVNSAGVLFGKGAQVNVGGIVASTLDISNADFMAGRYNFSGSSSASVINRGNIHASPGGYVSLLGKTVANDGVITANLGTVAMASGQQITLNFGGNSLVDVTISQGTLNALVSNKRAIIANGGQVIMTAKAADEVLSAQVNNTGIIQARTMAALTGGGSGTRVVHKGSIKLLAQGGTVNVSGKLDASAPKGGDGGSIETSGNKVHVADTAVITTKSANGQDGNWLIDPDGFTIAATGGDITGAALATALASNDPRPPVARRRRRRRQCGQRTQCCDDRRKYCQSQLQPVAEMEQHSAESIGAERVQHQRLCPPDLVERCPDGLRRQRQYRFRQQPYGVAQRSDLRPERRF
jgi:filamentous hemagglutinin family protein